MTPIQGVLFDPSMLTTDGLPRDCPCCKGTGVLRSRDEIYAGTGGVVCKNCDGTGRAKIPY